MTKRKKSKKTPMGKIIPVVFGGRHPVLPKRKGKKKRKKSRMQRMQEMQQFLMETLHERGFSNEEIINVMLDNIAMAMTAGKVSFLDVIGYFYTVQAILEASEE